MFNSLVENTGQRDGMVVCRVIFVTSLCISAIEPVFRNGASVVELWGKNTKKKNQLIGMRSILRQLWVFDQGPRFYGAGDQVSPMS